MQQRRLRLGDILDDYCPRERRITNHVVVAMIDDQVKQTRCSTCDADHEYKQARVPAPRRKKDGVLAGDPADAGRPRAGAPESDMSDDELIPDDVDAPDEAPIEAAAALEGEPETDGDNVDVPPDDAAAPSGDDDGPVHRRLIRATLPRQEGQVPERKMPEFTVRQPGGRGRDFDANRGGMGGSGGGMGGPGGGGQRHGRGRRAMRGPQQPGQSSGQPPRFGGPRQGSPQGQRDGNRPNPPGGQRGGSGRPQGQSRGPGRKRGR